METLPPSLVPRNPSEGWMNGSKAEYSGSPDHPQGSAKNRLVPLSPELEARAKPVVHVTQLSICGVRSEPFSEDLTSPAPGDTIRTASVLAPLKLSHIAPSKAGPAPIRSGNLGRVIVTSELLVGNRDCTPGLRCDSASFYPLPGSQILSPKALGLLCVCLLVNTGLPRLALNSLDS